MFDSIISYTVGGKASPSLVDNEIYIQKVNRDLMFARRLLTEKLLKYLDVIISCIKKF